MRRNLKSICKSIRKASNAFCLCVCLFCGLPNTLQAQTSEGAPQAAENFQGFALQAAVGYQPYVVRFNQLGIANTNINLPDKNYYSSSVPYFIGASYTTLIGRDVTIGAQIEVNPVNQQYVLSLLPGYAFTPDIQGYIKLAWVNAMMTIDQGSSQNKISATINGATAGLGVKQFLNQNWYGFIEANYVMMDKIKFNSPINGIPVTGNMDYSGYNAMVGIGYKF